jgi:hypothetical protein
MGKDNQPKERQQRKVERKLGNRSSCDRILIVCEGKKTEPLYFEEIRQYYRLSKSIICVQPSQVGTSSEQVVECARDLFLNGDPHKKISKKAFEQVFAVFDRDDHDKYHEALTLASSLNGKLRNDERKKVIFRAIPSVPCFELWLLLHYENIHHDHEIHRDDVQKRLKTYIPEYDKGAGGYFELTRPRLAEAIQRAQALVGKTTAYNGEQPYTDIGYLVDLLISLKKTL